MLSPCDFASVAGSLLENGMPQGGVPLKLSALGGAFSVLQGRVLSVYFHLVLFQEKLGDLEAAVAGRDVQEGEAGGRVARVDVPAERTLKVTG